MGLYGGYVAPSSYANLAETDRQFVKHMSGDTPGVVGLNDFKVAPGSGMSVAVQSGRAFCEGKNVATQGYYMGWADTNTTVSIGVAGSQDRIDRIILCVRDEQYGSLPSGKANGPEIFVVAGTPAITPVAPTDSAVTTAVGPGGWTELAQVRVVASSSSISAANVADKRTFSFSKRYVDQRGPRWSGYVPSNASTNSGWFMVPTWTDDYLLGGMSKIGQAIIVPKTGLYQVRMQACWSAQASPAGVRQVIVRKNPTSNIQDGTSGSNPGGTTLAQHYNPGTSLGLYQHVLTEKTVPLLAGDRVLFVHYHVQGAAINVQGGAENLYAQLNWDGESS